MQAWSRRKILGSGIAAGSLTAAVALGWHPRKRSSTRGSVRLLPVEGVAYSESFLHFMKRAKFDSVRDAISGIRDRSVPVRVAHVSQAATRDPFLSSPSHPQGIP